MPPPLATRSHSPALARSMQEVDPRSDDGTVGLGERRLLPDDRRQVAVEGEDEILDLPLLELAGRPGQEAAGGGRRLVEAPASVVMLMKLKIVGMAPSWVKPKPRI